MAPSLEEPTTADVFDAPSKAAPKLVAPEPGTLIAYSFNCIIIIIIIIICITNN